MGKSRRDARSFSVRAALAVAFMGAWLALAAPSARADNLAEQFQQDVTPGEWPAANSPIRQLLDGIEDNQKRDWPSDGGPMPPGTPPDVERVEIRKSFKTDFWSSSCTGLCSKETGEYQVVIHFSDGSEFFYRYSWSKLACGDTNDTSITRSREVWDMSSIEHTVDHPSKFNVRKYNNTDTEATHTSEASYSLRADAGATFSPPGGLQSLVTPGATVEFRGGPGSTLDLQGYTPSAPVLTSSAPAQIYADTVLLSPGVTLNSLFSPPPVLHAAEDIHDLHAALERYPKEMPPSTSQCRMRVTNFGTEPEFVSVLWSDTAGWVFPAGDSDLIMPGQGRTFNIGVATPPLAPPCAFTDMTFTATGLSGAEASYVLRIFGPGDLDGDGVKNSADNSATVSNPGQDDADHDSRGDATDNCPLEFNPLQEDSDFDGMGDACDPPCRPDFNNDHLVNVGDIFAFLAAWFAQVGQTGPGHSADFNRDGVVNVTDIFAFLAAWFAGCP